MVWFVWSKQLSFSCVVTRWHVCAVVMWTASTGATATKVGTVFAPGWQLEQDASVVRVPSIHFCPESQLKNGLHSFLFCFKRSNHNTTLQVTRKGQKRKERGEELVRQSQGLGRKCKAAQLSTDLLTFSRPGTCRPHSSCSLSALRLAGTFQLGTACRRKG